MGLFDPGNATTLADVLNQQAQTASTGIVQDYAKKRRKAVSQQAAGGRLGSGVANYTLGDINAGELSDLGGIQSNLANALAGIPAEDYLGQQQDARNRQLAELIARLSKPSDLEQAFGAIGGVGRIAGTAAAFL